VRFPFVPTSWEAVWCGAVLIGWDCTVTVPWVLVSAHLDGSRFSSSIVRLPHKRNGSDSTVIPHSHPAFSSSGFATPIYNLMHDYLMLSCPLFERTCISHLAIISILEPMALFSASCCFFAWMTSTSISFHVCIADKGGVHVALKNDHPIPS
jgi:hypothetical protein